MDSRILPCNLVNGWFKHVYIKVCMILLDVLNFFLAPKWLVVTLTLVSARPPVSGNNYSCFSSVSRYCLPSAYLHQSPAQAPHWLLARNPRQRVSLSDVIRWSWGHQGFAGLWSQFVASLCGEDWQEASNLPDRDTMPPLATRDW